MKKIVVFVVSIACVISAFAADVLITGFDAVTGIGTFKVVSDGTDATLTVDKLVVSDAITAPGGVSGSSTVVTNLSGLAAFATNIAPTYVTNTWTYLDASTNLATNTVITTTYSVQTRTPAVQQASITFVSGICTNKP
jgi:hypothetical protein